GARRGAAPTAGRAGRAAATAQAGRRPHVHPWPAAPRRPARPAVGAVMSGTDGVWRCTSCDRGGGWHAAGCPEYLRSLGEAELDERALDELPDLGVELRRLE